MNMLDYCSEVALGHRYAGLNVIDMQPKHWVGIRFFEMKSFLLLISIIMLKKTCTCKKISCWA